MCIRDSFKAYDIRGVYPTDLNEDAAYAIGRAFVTFLKVDKVLVGRDMRTSGPQIFHAVTRGLMDQGADVVNIGMVSTDQYYFACSQLRLPGMMVTASHNPKQYNGFKMVRQMTYLLSGAEGIQELTAQFRELGGEISGETANRAAEFNDDLNLLRAALQGVANRIAASVLPALGDLARGLVESAKTGGSLRAILDGVVFALKIVALGAAVTTNGFLALGEAMGAGLAAGVAGLKGNVGQAKAILGELETSLAARRDRMIQFHDSLFLSLIHI